MSTPEGIVISVLGICILLGIVVLIFIQIHNNMSSALLDYCIRGGNVSNLTVLQNSLL